MGRVLRRVVIRRSGRVQVPISGRNCCNGAHCVSGVSCGRSRRKVPCLVRGQTSKGRRYRGRCGALFRPYTAPRGAKNTTQASGVCKDISGLNIMARPAARHVSRVNGVMQRGSGQYESIRSRGQRVTGDMLITGRDRFPRRVNNRRRCRGARCVVVAGGFIPSVFPRFDRASGNCTNGQQRQRVTRVTINVLRVTDRHRRNNVINDV